MRTPISLIKASILEGRQYYISRDFEQAQEKFMQAKLEAEDHKAKPDFHLQTIEASIWLLHCYTKMADAAKEIQFANQYSNQALAEYNAIQQALSDIENSVDQAALDKINHFFQKASKECAPILYPLLWNQALAHIEEIEKQELLSNIIKLYDMACAKFEICRQFEIEIEEFTDARKTAQRLQQLLEEQGCLFAVEANNNAHEDLKLQYYEISQASFKKSLLWTEHYTCPDLDDIIARLQQKIIPDLAAVASPNLLPLPDSPSVALQTALHTHLCSDREYEENLISDNCYNNVATLLLQHPTYITEKQATNLELENSETDYDTEEDPSIVNLYRP